MDPRFLFRSSPSLALLAPGVLAACLAAGLALHAAPLAGEDPDAIRLAAPVRLAAVDGPIAVDEHVGHAGPLFADVFGRGTADLLVGTFRGHIAVWRNEAEAGEFPRFVADGLLEAEGEPIRVHNW